METAKSQSTPQGNVKKEPVTPAKGNENGESGFTGGRGGGSNNRGGSRGGRGGSNSERGGLAGGRGGANAERGGFAGGRGGSGGGRGGGGAGNTGGGAGSGTSPSPTPGSDRGGYGGGRGSGDRGGRGGAGGRGSYGGRGGGSERGRGRGRGYGRGGYMSGDRDKYPGGYGGMREMDRIAERLKALAGPMTDLPPREESEKKFSNHCRLWVGNLPLDINEDDVKELFKPFGEFDEVYFDKNKGFAFVRMDYKSNAEKARHDLHLKDYKGRQLKIRFSSPGTALKVRNISSWVTNELLEKAFSVFGDVEKAIVVTDERGKTAGEGIVEFCKKPAANLAYRKCQDGCFFLTTSPRPVVVEAMAITDDNEGMSEVNINKRNPEYIKERQQGPRFAHPGSFEYEYGLKWKQLYELFDKKKEALEKELGDEKKKLEEQIEYAKYEHETEMLRDQLRQREEMNQRNKQEFELKQREWEEHKRLEEERQRTQEEELALKFRQQEEELRRRQEENRQFMQERAMSMMKQENYSNYNNSMEGSNSWRRGSDNYQSEGGSSWRGGSGGASGGNWNRQNEIGTRSGSQTSWGSGGGGGGGDSWNNRQDNWNQSETGRSNYQRSESELPPPPDPHTFLENFNRGRNFDESSADYSHRNRDGVRSRWARSDRDDYGPAKRARY